MTISKYRRRAAASFKVAAILGFATVVFAAVFVGTGWGWVDIAGPVLIVLFGVAFVAMVVFWVLSLRRRPAPTKTAWASPGDRPSPAGRGAHRG